MRAGQTSQPKKNVLLLVVLRMGEGKPNEPVFGQLFNVWLYDVKTSLVEISFPVQKRMTKFSARNDEEKVSGERRAAHR